MRRLYRVNNSIWEFDKNGIKLTVLEERIINNRIDRHFAMTDITDIRAFFDTVIAIIDYIFGVGIENSHLEKAREELVAFLEEVKKR